MGHQADISDEEALHDLESDDLQHITAPIPRSESSKRTRGRSDMKRIKSGACIGKVAAAQHKLFRGAAHHHHHHHHHSSSPHNQHKKSVKGAKQKAIMKARAFKDLDMTIELLGIDSSKHTATVLGTGSSIHTSMSDRMMIICQTAPSAGGITGASPGWATPPATASAAYTPAPSAAAAASTGRSSSGVGAALSRSSSAGSGGAPAAVHRSSSSINSSSGNAVLPPGRMSVSADGAAAAAPMVRLQEGGESTAVAGSKEAAAAAVHEKQQQLHEHRVGQQQQQQRSWVAAVKAAPEGRKHKHVRSRSVTLAEVERSTSTPQQQQQQQQYQPDHQYQRQYQPQQQQQRRWEMYSPHPPPQIHPQQQQQQQQQSLHWQWQQQHSQPRPPARHPPWQQPPPPPPPHTAAAAAGARSSTAAAAVTAFGSPFSAQALQQPSRMSDSSTSIYGADLHLQQQQQQRGAHQGTAAAALMRRGSSGHSSGQGLPPPPPPTASGRSTALYHPAMYSGSSSSSTLLSPRSATREEGQAAAAAVGPASAAVQLSASHPAHQNSSYVSSPSSVDDLFSGPRTTRSKSARATLQTQPSSSSSVGGNLSLIDGASSVAVADRQGSSSSVASGSAAAAAAAAPAAGGQQQQQLAHHLSRRHQSSPFPRRRGCDGALHHHQQQQHQGGVFAAAGSSGVLTGQQVPDRALEKLQHDRAQWRSALHDALEGQAALSPEEIELSLAESAARAEDLTVELSDLTLSARTAATWKEREQCLVWLEEGFKRAKGISKEVKNQITLLQSHDRSGTYSRIVIKITPALTDLAAALADNMAAALAPMVFNHHHHQQQQQQQQNGQQQAAVDYSVHAQQDCIGATGPVQRAIAAAQEAAATAAAAGPGSGDGSSAAAGGGGVLCGGDDECRMAFKLVRRWLELCKEIKDRCRTNSQQVAAVQPVCAAAIDELHNAVLRLMGGSVAAAAYLQATLLTHQHLAPHSFAHKVTSDARLLILMWRYCHEMCGKVWRNFDTLRHTALLMLLELLSAAAVAATDMQRNAAAAAAAALAAAAAAAAPDGAGALPRQLVRSGSSSSSLNSDFGSTSRSHRSLGSAASLGSRSVAARSALGDISDESASDDELAIMPTGSSVWGLPPAGQGLGSRVMSGSGFNITRVGGSRGLAAASDDDVQAQAWLPQLLVGLLHWSSVTARQVCEELDSAEAYSDAGLPSLANEVEEELAAALEDLQESFFYLALTNTRRVARLTAAPEGLACWALEILRDAAEGALKFVQEYDTSALGLGQVIQATATQDQGERLFKSLKRSTDAVINGLLRVKRLLKIRRIDVEPSAAAMQTSRQQQPQQQHRRQQKQVRMSVEQPARQLNQQQQQQQQQRQAGQGQQQQQQQEEASAGAAAVECIFAMQEHHQNDIYCNSAAAIEAADGTGPGRPGSSSSSIIEITGSRPSTAAAGDTRSSPATATAAAAAAGSSPYASHMPLGYSPPGALTAAAHTHAIAAAQLSISPPQELPAAAAAAALSGMHLSPSTSPVRDESPPLAVLGTTPTAKVITMTTRKASRTLPLQLDVTSNGGSSSSSADAPAAAAAADKWAAYKSMSGSGKFPARPAASPKQQQQQQGIGSSNAGLVEPPKRQAAAAAAVQVPETVFSPFGAAAASAVPFSPAPGLSQQQQQAPWAGIGEDQQTHTQITKNTQQQQQQSALQLQQQQQSLAVESSSGSFVQRSRSFRDVLTAPAGAPSVSPTAAAAVAAATAAAAAAGSSRASGGSDRGSGPPTPVYVVSPFAPAAQQQQQQQGEVIRSSRTSAEGSAAAAAAAAANHPAGADQPHHQQQQQQPSLSSSADLLLKGSGGASLSDVALAASILGASSSSSRDQASASIDALLYSASNTGVELFSAAAAGSSDVLDVAAAADAIADASQNSNVSGSSTAAAAAGGGSGVSASQVVLPAALAILRMIQVSDDEFWKIRWCDLEPGLLRKLGNGSYGQVFQGVYLNAQVAIKVLNIDYDDPAGLSAETLLRFKAEVDFQRKLSYHPNVVRFIGACCELPAGLADALSEAAAAPATPGEGDGSNSGSGTQQQQQQRVVCGSRQRYIVPPGLARGVKLAIVMELCHLGSLFSMIGQARRVRAGLADGQPAADLRRAWPYGFQFQSDWLTRLEVMRGAAAGLEYMHQHGVVHRDLTSYNLLLDFGKPWQVKVCDFNLSRMVAQQQQLTNSGNPNSPGWQSPEMLSGQPYGKAADVFSFGVVMWEVITLKEPWREETEGRTALYYIMNAVTAGDRLALPEPHDLVCQGLGFNQAADLLNLAQSCWCQLPVERPTMAEVANRLGETVKAVRDERRAAAAAAVGGGGNGVLRGSSGGR